MATRVHAAWGVVVDWEFSADVEMAFEVCKLLMKTVHLHAVFDAQQGLVFSLEFGHNGPLVDFQLGPSLVVTAARR